PASKTRSPENSRDRCFKVFSKGPRQSCERCLNLNDGNRNFYAIAAGLFWGTSPVLVKRGLVDSDVSTATLIQQAAILFTLILFMLLEGSVSPGQVSTLAICVFIAIGTVGAHLGRTLFVKSVDQIGATRAQLVNNTSPLITVLLAALLLGERLTMTVVLSVIFIVSGIFFISRDELQPDRVPAK